MSVSFLSPLRYLLKQWKQLDVWIPGERDQSTEKSSVTIADEDTNPMGTENAYSLFFKKRIRLIHLGVKKKKIFIWQIPIFWEIQDREPDTCNLSWVRVCALGKGRHFSSQQPCARQHQSHPRLGHPQLVDSSWAQAWEADMWNINLPLTGVLIRTAHHGSLIIYLLCVTSNPYIHPAR